MKQQKALTLKTLTKSNVWEVEENDIFRMWETAEKESDFRDNRNHYIDVIRSAFEIEEIKIDKPEVIKKYEARDFKVGNIHFDDNENKKWGIKKRAINRITDLTYENIHHISAAKLMEVLDRNFGGGWDSLSQSVQDIIVAGFDISTTTLPKDRLHKPGGMYEKKVNDGYDVLEITKGLWVEAIFAKAKPKVEKQPVWMTTSLQRATSTMVMRTMISMTKSTTTHTTTMMRTTSTRTSSQKKAIVQHSKLRKISTSKQRMLQTMTINKPLLLKQSL